MVLVVTSFVSVRRSRTAYLPLARIHKILRYFNHTSRTENHKSLNSHEWIPCIVALGAYSQIEIWNWKMWHRMTVICFSCAQQTKRTAILRNECSNFLFDVESMVLARHYNLGYVRRQQQPLLTHSAGVSIEAMRDWVSCASSENIAHDMNSKTKWNKTPTVNSK